MQMDAVRECYRLCFCKRYTHLCIVIFGIMSIIIFFYQFQEINSERATMRVNDLTYNEVKLLIENVFDPSVSIDHLQLIWNKLMKLWKKILMKFVYDACQLCHNIDLNCYRSIDIEKYVYYINQSFYPSNDTIRPIGIGVYYYFDLKTLHSLNDSVLSTDVSYCDYFHMIELMINVQINLHRENIKYFLTKGAFLGSLRHHDIIPWDSDIDLFISSNNTKQLQNIFRNFNDSTMSRMKENDLVLYPFKNFYGVVSYKIFSPHSPKVNGTDYGWPKLDIFEYAQNSTHIYAYPKHHHNLGTMNYIEKTNIEPLYLRIVGPIMVPTPFHPVRSLKAMLKLGETNLFYVCEGNSYQYLSYKKSSEKWRLPCREIHRTYPFVQATWNSKNGLCYEELRRSQQTESLSYYIYKCDEHLQRTI